ncbi:MAG: diaminopimelate epimerase [Bacteroidales bacterium]|nr:diaminopimelate epimerase [Bacteroidales bacterium]
MELYKWSGAGNTFVVIDGRGGAVVDVISLCREYGTDGLMILRESPAGRDFAMEFFNPDGSSGMMCGNGGRCIVAFADYLRIGNGRHYEFDAPDGVHAAEILERPERAAKESGAAGEWTVRLQMKDVEGVTEYPDGLFLNTGTRHFVKFVPDVDAIDIEKEALPIRHDARFAPEGTNVNFVSLRQGAGQTGGPTIRIRTFEKGVEGETAACGTGITAAALVCRFKGIAPASESADGRIAYRLQARESTLSVDFFQKKKDAFSDVFLTGPARILTE